MFLVGLAVGLVIAFISPPGLVWSSLGISFVCVFLAGLISLVATGMMRQLVSNDIVRVLTGTVVRTGLIGVFLVVIIVTQQKNFVLYVLCFSMLFYLGMISLNTWLVLPAQPNHHETDSSRD